MLFFLSGFSTTTSYTAMHGYCLAVDLVGAQATKPNLADSTTKQPKLWTAQAGEPVRASENL